MGGWMRGGGKGVNCGQCLIRCTFVLHVCSDIDFFFLHKCRAGLKTNCGLLSLDLRDNACGPQVRWYAHTPTGMVPTHASVDLRRICLV